MLVFRSKIAILKTMLFFSRQNSKSPLAGALIIAHFVTCFLAPWFHQHPGQDHAEVKGDSYHSHALPFASYAQEFDQDHHDWQEGLHLLEGSRLFDKVQASAVTHFGQVFVPGKCVVKIDFFGSNPASISLPAFVVKTIIKFPDIQPTQDYFVLIATGLSPPLV